MTSFRQRNKTILGVVSLAFILLGTFAIAQLYQTESTPMDQDCIVCHIATVTKGMKSMFIHLPFSEQLCTLCHLADESESAEKGAARSVGPITGSEVTQEIMWRKDKIFSDRVPTQDHLVSAEGLELNMTYRFRIAVGDQGNRQPDEGYKTPWLGLKPGEISDFGIPGGNVINERLSAISNNSVNSLEIRRLDGGTLAFFWKSQEPLLGRIQVQELNGIMLSFLPDESTPEKESDTPDKTVHPKLKSRAEMSIDLCTGCHSASILGTSHPVRIYATNPDETKIPEDLPTIEGMLTCVTCHNPHGSPGKDLLRETIATKLCVACHYTFNGTSTSTLFE